jgi:hypothetical protein
VLFRSHKDFTQLLTDAAMKPESSHASISTQKFAIALSKTWIEAAYDDVIARNRAMVPPKVLINIDSFNDESADGRNEADLVNKFTSLVEREKNDALSKVVLDGFTNACKIAGPVIAGIGLIMIPVANIFLGLIAIIAGGLLFYNWYSKNKNLVVQRKNVEDGFAKKLHDGLIILRATLAEVVDFRKEFADEDQKSAKVLEFLDGITPDQYVKKLAGTRKHVKVG